MDKLDAKVIENFMVAQSLVVLVLIDELEKQHPGLKADFAAVLAKLVADEKARPRQDSQAITVLSGMLKGLQRKRPRTIH